MKILHRGFCKIMHGFKFFGFRLYAIFFKKITKGYFFAVCSTLLRELILLKKQIKIKALMFYLKMR